MFRDTASSGFRSVEQSTLSCIFVCKPRSRMSGSAVPEKPTKRCLHPQDEPARTTRHLHWLMRRWDTAGSADAFEDVIYGSGFYAPSRSRKSQPSWGFVRSTRSNTSHSFDLRSQNRSSTSIPFNSGLRNVLKREVPNRNVVLCPSVPCWCH